MIMCPNLSALALLMAIPAATTAAPPKIDPVVAKMHRAIDAYIANPPRGAPELARCDDVPNRAWCVGQQYQFITVTWPRAHHGDIERAGDVAFCLHDTNACGVEENPLQACAWAMAIVLSGSPDVGEVQTDHMQSYCRHLDPAALTGSRMRAATLASSLPMFREPRD